MPASIQRCPQVDCLEPLEPDCLVPVINFGFFSKPARFCPLCPVCPVDCLADPCSLLLKGVCFTMPFICADGDDAE